MRISSLAKIWCAAAAAIIMTGATARAENGSEGWLRYAPLSKAAQQRYASVPARIAGLDNSAMGQSAVAELKRGLGSMLGHDITADTTIGGDAFVVGTVDELKAALPAWHVPAAIGDEGFAIAQVRSGGHNYWVIAAKDGHGELYGVFHVLERVATEKPLIADTEAPSAPIRWTDEWDNFNGTIERGWAGPSIFFENNRVRADLSRVGAYGRLLASIGINGVAINNVNANP